MFQGKYRFNEKYLSDNLTQRGKDFVMSKVDEQRSKGIIEEVEDLHCVPLNIEKSIIKEHYFDFWANWDPGNKDDLYVNYDSEVEEFVHKKDIQDLYLNKCKRKGLYLYLAAKNDFRCYYTGVPLLPLKPGLIDSHVFNCPSQIYLKYAWYPSVDHRDSVTIADRHSLTNLLLLGLEVNRMFGALNKELAIQMMHYISSNASLPIQLIIDVAKHSLISSSREK